MAGTINRKTITLTPLQLRDGYSKSVDNAMRFFCAAFELLKKYPDKALAMAQVGQEELGRSLTLLAGFGLQQDVSAWEWFWKGWRDHQLKAHRAHLYELFSSLRMELREKSTGRVFSGQGIRPKISDEKEAGFYVDFDLTSGQFKAPSDQISRFEAVGRTVTLLYLFATAEAIRRTLFEGNEGFRLSTFGQLAFRVCSENIYQQDMPAILQDFRARSPEHDTLIADVEVAFAGYKPLFNELHQGNP